MGEIIRNEQNISRKENKLNNRNKYFLSDIFLNIRILNYKRINQIKGQRTVSQLMYSI